MLKYQLNTQTFDNDVVYLNYNSVDLTTYDEDPDNLMWVTLSCYDTGEIVHGDTLSITSNFIYFNDVTQTAGNATDACNIPVEIVDLMGGTVTFIDKTYKELFPDTIVAKSDADGVKWIISFPDTHYFNEFDTINLKFYYTDTDYIKINGLEYINFNTLSWDYDPEVAEELSTLIFGTSRPEPSDTIEGNPDKIVVRRDQVRWNRLDQNLPTVKVNKIKVRLDIPITLKSKTDLYKEGNINEYFVQHEKEKSINTSIEMEKYPYTPVVVKINNGNVSFEDCIKINFNLHFRVHDGDDWTVNDSDSWNFDKYGNHNDPRENKYYSYAQNASSIDAQSQWKRSCQSDLLGYADFTTNDVKYQKNKLKKSFIRLSFYDSNDPGKQSLLAYSTIFVDCNKLYSKFVSRMNFNCYFESDGDIVKGIKTNREVNTAIGPDSLSSILRKDVLTTDEIEDSRLSTQISVKNKFLSNSSSEGFYLYTWELNDDPNTPSDVYMKVEFNHAGYGRTIPMMAPYITKTERDDPSQGNPYYNKTGFKTNADIAGDWNGNRQYGIKRYTRYSYIHLKAKYDANTKRHIYYLDPDTYGTKYDCDKNVLNINLYEARIAFN